MCGRLTTWSEVLLNLTSQQNDDGFTIFTVIFFLRLLMFMSFYLFLHNNILVYRTAQPKPFSQPAKERYKKNKKKLKIIATFQDEWRNKDVEMNRFDHDDDWHN